MGKNNSTICKVGAVELAMAKGACLVCLTDERICTSYNVSVLLSPIITSHRLAATLEQAMPGLVDTHTPNNFGRATKHVARALRSRMYLYAASPLFNGNSEFYNDFVDAVRRSMGFTEIVLPIFDIRFLGR